MGQAVVGPPAFGLQHPRHFPPEVAAQVVIVPPGGVKSTFLGFTTAGCQSASKIDPLSACNIDPLSGTAEVVPVVNRGACGFV